MSFLINKLTELIESGQAVCAESLRDSIVSLDREKSRITISIGEYAKWHEMGVDSDMLNNGRLQGMVIWYQADTCAIRDEVARADAEKAAQKEQQVDG